MVKFIMLIGPPGSDHFEMPTKEEGFDSIYKCKTENGLITFYM